jgi:hypothetical protein
MSIIGNDELHPKNLIIFVFNVEVSLHVCSFSHGFGHLLTICPYRSSQVEVRLVLPTTLPLINPLVTPIPNYINIVPRIFDSHPCVEGNRGEFLRISNPTGNMFPSL